MFTYWQYAEPACTAYDAPMRCTDNGRYLLDPTSHSLFIRGCISLGSEGRVALPEIGFLQPKSINEFVTYARGSQMMTIFLRDLFSLQLHRLGHG